MFYLIKNGSKILYLLSSEDTINFFAEWKLLCNEILEHQKLSPKWKDYLNKSSEQDQIEWETYSKLLSDHINKNLKLVRDILKKYKAKDLDEAFINYLILKYKNTKKVDFKIIENIL